MKKKILAISLAVMLLAVAGYQTLAYFTAADKVTNTITADTLDIIINEYQLDEEEEEELISSGLNGIGIHAEDVVPGDTISKIVKVENLDASTDAWIRVRVVTSCVTKGGASEIVDPTTLVFNTTDWTKHTDGYYYYNTELAGGDETEALLDEVAFDVSVGNAYKGAKLTIMIDAQAVQARNNGASATAALGWPAF
jgi:predicted ribosomally synthesized peptide with SipW-like signal peptide